jgi:hypothetical protein
VEGYCVNLVLSWTNLISPLMVIESVLSIIVWVGICVLLTPFMRSAHDLLAFIVPGEKSGVILIGPPLYVI